MPKSHSIVPEGIDIPSCPDYRVSPCGKVLFWRSGRWQIMSPFIPDDGYPEVKLRVDGKRRTLKVHSLVLVAYVGPKPDGLQALHRDGNPRNNRLTNLRWGTPQENADDTIRHGRTLKGSKARAAKLVEKDVETILVYHQEGMPPARIARLWKISVSTAASICSRKSWKHVTIPNPA